MEAVKAKKKRDIGAFDIFLYVLMILVMIATLYPFLNVLAISLNDSMDTIKGSNFIIPREFTFDNYKEIFKYNNLVSAFFMSVLRTAVGTFTAVICTAMLAYVFSRRDYAFNRPVVVLFVITMYVSGGMIPEYMLIKNIGLVGKFSVYIIPALISVFNVIVMRSFIDGIPISLQESARIDGANDFVIFYKIIMPLCIPVLATISLFVAVGQWNSWFDTYLYSAGKAWLSTLQFEMIKIMDNTNATTAISQAQVNSNSVTNAVVSPQSIRMALTITATVPILLVYPFVQKYFVAGMTLGAVKS
ncbi:carbohydrate ABC transporter permease [Clostridium cellulovorans]|uniref:Binding-protein-dependent transport systems inner membrane component n=1 Tax=Clostridium cellulovorans (strain ATCC 35296 / DSM 3052 / OCM 3 / 743B) TaxID=573061 RepID=D9SMP4_CLOC7|nr:carbohydrate ABC transporter permease [Clostridium cellulovorans]ADL49829.1 binding-protein-dependent transport systems inner membrane component [Clostridium cellulovorans 743B]